MNVLAIIHGESVRSGVFGDVVRARGHELEEWSLAWETPLPRPLDAYGAVLVFGGAMHADQDEHHPWLREENFFLQRLLDLHTPVLGICLGAQLLAKAAHAPVFPVEEAEVGWFEVELTDAGADDQILGRLPDCEPPTVLPGAPPGAGQTRHQHDRGDRRDRAEQRREIGRASCRERVLLGV